VSKRIAAVQAPIIPILGEWIRQSPGTISLGQGMVAYGPPPEALAAAFPRSAGKTIVLTGAMVPYAFGSSDGLFNLGSALSFVQVLPAGVYVAMNGRCFSWDTVRKNAETGTFEAIDREEAGLDGGIR